jgi:membrane protein DedA with SNARE-associated domain
LPEIADLLTTYGYPAILVVTFLEGESIVILAGIAAADGLMSLPLIIATALAGSFVGDQFYYTLGRRFGTRILDRWPVLSGKTAWAFRLVRKHETLFILSFRFLYGVRNISPFVVAMAGVPRWRFLLLNLVAATLWANAFSFGGYYFGQVLQAAVGDNHLWVLAGLAALALGFGLFHWLRRRARSRAPASSP